MAPGLLQAMFPEGWGGMEALQSQGSPGDLLWLSEQLDNVGPGGGAGKAVQGHWV